MPSRLSLPTPEHVRIVLTTAIVVSIVAGCTGSADRKSGSAGDSASRATSTNTSGAMDTSPMHPTPSTSNGDNMSGSAGMATAPDHDFLRMMSDHHKSLIALVHETLEKKGTISVRDEAKALDRKQDAEIDRMSAMLRQYYSDSYTPTVPPDAKSMIDSVMTKSGPAFDRTFRESVIKHHQDAIRMVDEYLPKLTKPDVKAMAQKMKTDQEQEIADYQKQLGHK